MDIFDYFVNMPRWVKFCLIVIACIAGYLVYGNGVFDNIPWFTYYPSFNFIAIIVLKRVIVPALLVIGALCLFIYFCGN